MNIDLTGQTALITGASRGIGAAIFSPAGRGGRGRCRHRHRRFRLGGDSPMRQSMQLSRRGRSPTTPPTPNRARALIGEAENLLQSSPDIVVCNAAVNADGLLMRMKEDDWTRVLRTNLDGIFYLARAAVGGMIKKKRGRIIAVSSVVAAAGSAGQTNYCAAKAGAEGFIRALAREVAARGITANAIAPGFVETDMTAKLPPALREKYLENVPLKRAGVPDDIAGGRAVFGVGGRVLHHRPNASHQRRHADAISMRQPRGKVAKLSADALQFFSQTFF